MEIESVSKQKTGLQEISFCIIKFLAVKEV
jgi:hypothetical protein